MALNNRNAKPDDQFTLRGQTFTVHTVSPAGSGGRSFAAGPIIGAWLRPGGYGVTIDESTEGVEWIEPAAAAPAATADNGCVLVEVDGEPFRVHNGALMDAEDHKHFAQIVRTAKAHVNADSTSTGGIQ